MERTMKTQQKNVKINYKQTDRGAQLTMGDGKSSQVLSFQKSLNKKNMAFYLLYNYEFSEALRIL